MKAAKVGYQLGVGGFGKEKDEPERLHEESMRKDNDAAAGFTTHEAADCFASAIEEDAEGLGSGAVGEIGIEPPPVGDDVGFAVCFGGVVVARWLEKVEFLDGPLFDGNVRETPTQRLRSLLRPHKW